MHRRSYLLWSPVIIKGNKKGEHTEWEETKKKGREKTIFGVSFVKKPTVRQKYLALNMLPPS